MQHTRSSLRPAVVTGGIAGGFMGIFINLLPDAWSLPQVVAVSVPGAIVVGACAGLLVGRFWKG